MPQPTNLLTLPYCPHQTPDPPGRLITIFETNPIRPGVYVEPSPAQEPDEGHTELPGHVDSEAARGGDGAHEGGPGGQALLQDLEAAASADQDDVIGERQPPFEQRPPDELVRRVVPTYVFPQREKLSCVVEEGRRV